MKNLHVVKTFFVCLRELVVKRTLECMNNYVFTHCHLIDIFTSYTSSVECNKSRQSVSHELLSIGWVINEFNWNASNNKFVLSCFEYNILINDVAQVAHSTFVRLNQDIYLFRGKMILVQLKWRTWHNAAFNWNAFTW